MHTPGRGLQCCDHAVSITKSIRDRYRSRHARCTSTSPASHCTGFPGHPVASNVVSLLNIVLPAAERWFVDDVQRGIAIGEGSPSWPTTCAASSARRPPTPTSTSRCCTSSWSPTASTPNRCSTRSSTCSPRCWRRRHPPTRSGGCNHLCDRLWLIAAVEHYTAVMGDFALNCAWDDHGADPTHSRPVPLARQRGSRTPQRRPRRRRLLSRQLPRPDPRHDDGGGWRSFVFFQRGGVVPGQGRPAIPTSVGGGCNRLRMRDSKLGLLPKYRKLFGSNTADVLPARIHAGGDGFDGAGGRLPGQLPRGSRGTHLMGLLDRYRQTPPSVSGPDAP